MKSKFRFPSPVKAELARRAKRDEYLADCLAYCAAVVQSLRDFLQVYEAQLSQMEFDTGGFDPPSDQLSGAAAFDWLREKHPTVLIRTLRKRVLVGAAWNIVDFVEEAIQLATKGKAAPAYALLRRPLKDDLAILELLAHDDGGLVRALEEGPRAIAELLNYGSSPSARSPIASAIATTTYSWAHDADFIFSLRYERTAPYSLDGYWNRALHVATTARGIESGPYTLNMYFPDPESTQTTLIDFGHRTGALIHYAVDLVDALAVKFGGLEPAEERTRATARMLTRVWFEHEVAGCNFGHFEPFAWTRILNADVRHDCCGWERSADGELVEALKPEGLVCRGCGSRIDVSRMELRPYRNNDEAVGTPTMDGFRPRRLRRGRKAERASTGLA